LSFGEQKMSALITNIFKRKKAALITQKEQHNQVHNELDVIFNEQFRSEILDYFKMHFPGLDSMNEEDTGYTYHQDYHQLKQAFIHTPIDYLKAVEAMARLHAFIDKHPRQYIDDDKTLISRIRHLI
jgi:hypothetical protein